MCRPVIEFGCYFWLSVKVSGFYCETFSFLLARITIFLFQLRLGSIIHDDSLRNLHFKLISEPNMSHYRDKNDTYDIKKQSFNLYIWFSIHTLLFLLLCNTADYLHSFNYSCGQYSIVSQTNPTNGFCLTKY